MFSKHSDKIGLFQCTHFNLLTSHVFGHCSQYSSNFISPRSVCRVTASISENNLYLNETKFLFTCRSTSLKTDCKIDYQLYEKVTNTHYHCTIAGMEANLKYDTKTFLLGFSRATAICFFGPKPR